MFKPITVPKVFKNQRFGLAGQQVTQMYCQLAGNTNENKCHAPAVVLCIIFLVLAFPSIFNQVAAQPLSAQRSDISTATLNASATMTSEARLTDADNFHYSNIETLLTSGERYAEEGQYQLAERTFAQAAQTIRVNHGLYAPQQMEVVQKQIEALIPQQRWQELDEKIAYYEWLVNKNFSHAPEHFARRLSDLSDTLMTATLSASAENQTYYLTKSRRLNWHAVTAIQTWFGRNDPRQVPQLYKIALSHYFQIGLNQTAGVSSFNFKSDSRNLVNGWSLRKNEIVSHSYNTGRQLIARIGSILQNTDMQPETNALINIYLSDWDYLFGKHDIAVNGYQQARTQLEQTSIDQSEIDQLFYEATSLPLARPVAAWHDFLPMTKQSNWLSQLGFSESDVEKELDFHVRIDRPLLTGGSHEF